MNENVFFDWNTPFKNPSCHYGMPPELKSVEDLRFQESHIYQLNWYSTPAKVFDEFLKEFFGYNIEEFRTFYLRKHRPNMSEEQILGLAKFANPIQENIRVYFEKSNSLFELMVKYERCKSVIENHSCSGPLWLHDDSISNFTLIRANFSNSNIKPDSLENVKKQKFFGYFISTEKFRFLISSSMQLDLTVVYEEI